MSPLPTPTRGYLTFRQLGAYLGYQGVHARCSAAKWVKRTGCPVQWRGRAQLVNPDTVDALLRGEPVGLVLWKGRQSA